QLGASETQRKLNINFFGTPQSSDSQTLWGVTFGFGGMYHPYNWNVAGMPVALFGQINFTDWQNGNYVNPLGSPFFTYKPERRDVTGMAGLTIMFNTLGRAYVLP